MKIQNHGRLWYTIPLLLFLLITGCAGLKGEPLQVPVAKVHKETAKHVSSGTSVASGGHIVAPEKKSPSKRITAKPEGSGAQPALSEGLAQGKSTQVPVSADSLVRRQDKPIHVELAFDNADIYEVLDATLYKLFKVSYVADPSLRAKVTFHVAGDYTRDQFINLLNNVLQLSNLAVVKGPGHIYKVVRRNYAGAVGADVYLNTNVVPRAAGDITRLIKLRYISTSSAARSLKPFLSPAAVISQEPLTNSIIITDTPSNINKALSIISAIDVAFFKDISWRLIPIKEVDATDMARDLDKMLRTSGLYNRPGADKGAFSIMPVKTMNAILVASRWPEVLSLVDQWIEAMDHAEESGTNVYVYFVQNGNATDLADILKQVFGGEPAKKHKRTTIVEPTKKGTSYISGEVAGQVEIIPDEANNALIIRANRRDYEMIRRVLKKVDITPRQVLIDVMVAEVTLSGSIEYGIEWFLQGHRANYTVQGALDNAVARPISTTLGTTNGFFYSVYDPFSFMRGLINALGKESQVNILSSPNLLVVDNKEATIQVGEEIPVVTGKVTDATSGSTVTSTIQYRKTGIILKVKPHINSSGLVKMEITQEVSDKGTYDTALNTYSILTRKADTSLVAQDGQTILIGGIMKSKNTEGGSGIPFLRRIPILGYLFGGKTVEKEKTELIILITPHVISNRAEADAITREFSQRVKQLQGLIEEGKRQRHSSGNH